MTATERQSRYMGRLKEDQDARQDDLIALRAEASRHREQLRADQEELRALRAEASRSQEQMRRDQDELGALRAIGSLSSALPGVDRAVLSAVATQRGEPAAAVAVALLQGVLRTLPSTATAEEMTARVVRLLNTYRLKKV